MTFSPFSVGIQRRGRSRGGPAGMLPKYFSIEAPGFRGVEVPGDDEGQVVRRVVGLEEVLDVLERRRRQVLMAADDGPGIGVARREEVLRDELEPAPVGRVLEALAPLVLDDVPLVVELLLGEGVGQGREPVRFEPEDELEAGRRDGDEVVRPIVVGRAVDATLQQIRPGALGVGEVILRGVLGTLEHHVLEEVCKTRSSRLFVLRSHVKPEIDVHDWQLAVLVQDDLQAVGQREGLEGDLRHCRSRGDSGGWLCRGLGVHTRGADGGRERQTDEDGTFPAQELLLSTDQAHTTRDLEEIRREMPRVLRRRRGLR